MNLAGVCDCHMHIYNPQFTPQRPASIPARGGTLVEYRKVRERLGIERTVIVQPTGYGTDNGCTMDAVAALGTLPTQITLFTLSVREGSINRKTLSEDDPADLFRRSLAFYRYSKRRMLAHGYWQYSRNLFPRENWIFHYQDNHWGNNGYVLALGASGYSHSQNFTYLNAFNYRDYMHRIEAGESTVERVRPLDAEESLRRHLVLAMKHNEIDKARFESFYPAGSRPLERFRTVFDAMAALGIVEPIPVAIRVV